LHVKREGGCVKTIALMLVLGLFVLGAFGSFTRVDKPQAYDPQISPSDFVAAVDNVYFPLFPGRVLRYSQTGPDGASSVEVTVMADTKNILGVKCVVVHDVVRTANGDLAEDTYDWYAQDKTGNVWYFGEDTRSYEGGAVVTTKGTWQAGVAGARPGIVMEAAPKLGDTYRQEYLAGVAEDRADILSLTESVSVAYGTLANCLMTKDYSTLEPAKVEHKYFYPGVGQVLAVMVSGGTEREELISVTK